MIYEQYLIIWGKIMRELLMIKEMIGDAAASKASNRAACTND